MHSVAECSLVSGRACVMWMVYLEALKIGHEFRVQYEGNFCYAMYDLIILCIKLIILQNLTLYLSKEFSF